MATLRDCTVCVFLSRWLIPIQLVPIWFYFLHWFIRTRSVSPATSESTKQARVPWNRTRASVCRLHLCTCYPPLGRYQLYRLNINTSLAKEQSIQPGSPTFKNTAEHQILQWLYTSQTKSSPSLNLSLHIG
ncbi:hypothetical protein LSAT2_027321 [Lamellibrachia satsuma]|nr:hypothetical protein LSAT2_027321 [Lamellibrachia satsuma]